MSFGWSLPPGVTSAMIDGMYEERPRLRCSSCGAFLPDEADRQEYAEDAIDCDGSERILQQPYDESLITILGEEYRDQTYGVSVSPCGIDRGKHEPHREIMHADSFGVRKCRRCGVENRD